MNYLWKMRGYPQFSFWISLGLVKIYISCIITHRGKISLISRHRPSLTGGLTDVPSWLHANFLILNLEETKIMLVGTHQRTAEADLPTFCFENEWDWAQYPAEGGLPPADGRQSPRGIRGHAPPENFWKFESLKCDFLHFQKRFTTF